MNYSSPTRIAFVLIGLLALMQPIRAQLKMPEVSPSTTVKQKIGFTDLTITYARPATKGRVIFGSLVPYGQLWRTGAGDATILTLSDPMVIAGKPLPAGRYSLFTIPERTEWTVILNSYTEGHGTAGYEAKNDVLRFTVKPDSSVRFYESFTIDVQDLVKNGANLYLTWANTSVHFSLVSNADERITAEIMKRVTSATDGEAGVFYQSALYYFDTGKDTKQALVWATKAATGKPAFNYLHLQAKLLAKTGYYKAAIAAARKSSELAVEKKNAEIVTLNSQLIAEWEKKL
jgi:hypothetical protein